jgi:hypothetical protein
MEHASSFARCIPDDVVSTILRMKRIVETRERFMPLWQILEDHFKRRPKVQVRKSTYMWDTDDDDAPLECFIDLGLYTLCYGLKGYNEDAEWCSDVLVCNAGENGSRCLAFKFDFTGRDLFIEW